MAIPPETQLQSSSWTSRLATATGALAAVALSPAASKALVINVTGSPVSLSPTAGSGATSFWDVDGDGSNDFRLFNASLSGLALFLGSTGSNGKGLIAPFTTDNVIALNTSFNVGPTLASVVWGPSYQSRRMMENAGTIGYDWNFGFGQGDNFFGFRFEKLGGLHYGYAVANFDSPNKLVTISRWAYNNVADGFTPVEPIAANAPAVPGPIGLAGLAAGAAWTRKLRRRIKTAA